ncbi:MAG TPA: class I SAM-dependent methyltransferase [Candidatus Acidoferrum sp.]|nr:class I SAM-dependent methyltransferase [Candidatus Acidoferrum sp.]
MKQETDDVREFNRRSTTYESSRKQWLFFDRLQRAVLGLVESEANPESILDVGCGTGRLLRKAGERWPNSRLIGVDPAEGMIEKARLLMPNATFYVGMAESLPLPDASVDLAFSTASFHHWRDKVQGVCEVRRVLRPGGRFFLADIWPPLGLSRVFRHFRANDPARVRDVFVRAGLNVQAQRKLMGRFLLVTAGIV